MMNRFDTYAAFYQKGEREGWTLSIEQEKIAYKTTNTTIGALMAQQWGLPESLTNAIYNLHYADGVFDDSSMSQTTQSLIGILKMARYLSHVHLDTGLGEDEWLQVESQVFSFFKLSDDKWLSIKDTVLTALNEQD